MYQLLPLLVGMCHRSGTGFSPRGPRFDPRPVNVGFVVDKVALEQVLLQNLLLSPVSVTTTTIAVTVMATALSVHLITVAQAAPYVHRHAAEYAREHEEASQDVQGYLSNPINAYLLVKRLTTDWKEVETQMVDDAGKGTTHRYTLFELSITEQSCTIHRSYCSSRRCVRTKSYKYFCNNGLLCYVWAPCMFNSVSHTHTHTHTLSFCLQVYLVPHHSLSPCMKRFLQFATVPFTSRMVFSVIAVLKMQAACDVTLCRCVSSSQHWGRSKCLHFEDELSKTSETYCAA